jgi:hypothetical protein
MRPLLLLAAVWALAGCEPRARILVTRVEGVKPPNAILRCQTDGIERPRFTWQLGKAIQQIGLRPPNDEGALLVQWNDGAPSTDLTVACSADDGSGKPLSASTSLATLQIARVQVAGGLITVEGSGFGARAGADDGVWLLTRGAARRADSSCPRARWNDARIVACVTPDVTSLARVETRVQSGGRLARAPEAALK